MWVIPNVTPEFEERMFDVLDTYAKPYDQDQPVICLDEKNHQLLSDIKKPIKMKPGKCLRIDYEYRREAVRNEFVVIEPKAGRRHIRTTNKRAGSDWAKLIGFITLKMYPEAKLIHIIEDNLNTHNIKYLYEVYGNDKAEAILSRIEFHPTPKHASWLDMAEIEIGIFSRMVLGKRIATDKELKRQKDAYVKNRNKVKAKINWIFTRGQAIKKFKLETMCNN
mgnify:CR=1 FL=1